MPLNPVALAPPVIAGSGSADPIGIASWTVISSVIVTWCLGIVCNATGGTPLIAIGPVITGTGALVPAVPGPALGLLLAAASGSVDPAGITHWIAVANELARWVATGGVNPNTLVAFVNIAPAPGPVSGAAQLSIPGQPDLATAAGLQPSDTTGRAHWQAIASAIATHMNTLGLMTPAGMTNPGTGGPVVGVGTVA